MTPGTILRNTEVPYIKVMQHCVVSAALPNVWKPHGKQHGKEDGHWACSGIGQKDAMGLGCGAFSPTMESNRKITW